MSLRRTWKGPLACLRILPPLPTKKACVSHACKNRIPNLGKLFLFFGKSVRKENLFLKLFQMKSDWVDVAKVKNHFNGNFKLIF